MLQVKQMMIVAACGLGLLFTGSLAQAAEKKEKSEAKVHQFKVKDIHGKDVDMSKYQGKVLLIVNVASKCGATPQYKDLEALHEKYSKKGLAILGFPCNQFGKQEPGSNEQILEFCEDTYGVKFDMFSKIEVNGDNADPLYKYLTSKDAVGEKEAGNVKWNFEKFLVSRDGKVVARIRTRTKPTAPKVVKAIEKELGVEKE